MGKPGGGDAPSSGSEHIGIGGERRELKHLSTCRKGKRSDFLSSGERNGKSPNRIRVKPVSVACPGSREHLSSLHGGGRKLQRSALAEEFWKVQPQRVIAP